MNDVGVVLKLPRGLHAKVKKACQKQDRSMQKMLVKLISNWVEEGAVNPYKD